MIKFRNALHNEKGFTLIELLVVVIIIGILAAVALPNLIGASDDAKEKRLEADLKTFATALEVYYNEKGEYPDTAADGTLEDIIAGDFDQLKSVPNDPWGGLYTYSSNNAADPKTFTLESSKGGAVAADEDGKRWLNQAGIQDVVTE